MNIFTNFNATSPLTPLLGSHFTPLQCCARLQLFLRVLNPPAKSSFKGKKCTVEYILGVLTGIPTYTQTKQKQPFSFSCKVEFQRYEMHR